MKYLAFTILGILSFTSIAMAKDKTDGVSSGIAVEKILCKQAALPPSSDVAYKPGVDVNGNPVTPADGGAQMPIQSHYTEVPLNVDLAQRMHIPQINEANMTVASLRIYDDGRVLYNGQDVTQNANVICGRPAGPAPAPQVVNDMNMPENPLPGSAAPSATTPAR